MKYTPRDIVDSMKKYGSQTKQSDCHIFLYIGFGCQKVAHKLVIGKLHKDKTFL